jgi:hypothetical protein
MFPDKPNARNYKTKEQAVVDFVRSAFTSYDWIADKTVQDGCSKRRPDLFLHMGDQVIIVEVDENHHQAYDCSCENKRIMELSLDVGHAPIVFIRFNPDAYLMATGVKITSCWGTDKTGVCVIKKSKAEEWRMRLDSLKEQIQYWVVNRTDKTVEVVQLFYDQ